MNFLNDSWADMGQKEDVDFSRDTGQPFQLVVPRKKKSKKQQLGASKGFKESKVVIENFIETKVEGKIQRD
uniref:Uncharacterized protein n=1 Tax=Medicago truncatula TaxID=3880 RepID=A2Q6G8_MEDTR|nr:hypothetical protein MtrDRAFT_AC183371g15v1 [Medicago truncatula]